MQRRRLLQLGTASATLVALAGGAWSLVKPGLQGGRLSESGRDVLSAVGAAVLDGTLPRQDGPRQIALQGLLSRIDGLVVQLPEPTQAELSQLLALLASGPGRRALAGLATPWAEADTAELQAALQSMRVSGLALRQQAYQALHDIVGAAYFADVSTWSQLGYPGPVAT
jgi:hypothetical protein